MSSAVPGPPALRHGGAASGGLGTGQREVLRGPGADVPCEAALETTLGAGAGPWELRDLGLQRRCFLSFEGEVL